MCHACTLSATCMYRNRYCGPNNIISSSGRILMCLYLRMHFSEFGVVALSFNWYTCTCIITPTPTEYEYTLYIYILLVWGLDFSKQL